MVLHTQRQRPHLRLLPLLEARARRPSPVYIEMIRVPARRYAVARRRALVLHGGCTRRCSQLLRRGSCGEV